MPKEVEQTEKPENEVKKPLAPKISKKERREREIQNLNNALANGNLNTLISRVAHILNRYEDTRNSDMALKLKYWEVFEGFKGATIDVREMFKYTRDTQIARARAKIQNEYKLFQADDRIKAYRNGLEETEKELQIANKPGTPSITMYTDESGKTGGNKYMIIGGLWVLSSDRVSTLMKHFTDWKTERKDQGLPREFHFNEMKKNQLQIYKEFFSELLTLSDMISLKAVVTDRTTNRSKSIDEMVYSLYYQHVHQGVEHEVKTGRVVLPRVVNFWKDSEDSSDKFFLEELKQHLVTNFELYFKKDLALNTFGPINSYTSPMIQLADLYTGCINRALNQVNNGEKNHKDEFVEYVFNLLGIDLDDIKNQDSDMAMIHFM